MRLKGEISLLIVAFTAILNSVCGDDPVVKITQTTPAKDEVDGYIKCPKNNDALLTCAVTNKPVKADVKWIVTALHGGEDGILTPISTDLNSEDPFKYSLEKPSPTAWRLKVQNVQVSDEGRYICRVQTASQNYASAVADLRVTEVPQIADLQTSSDTIVKVGDNVRLSCNATGRPFPKVVWRRLAGELLPNGGQALQDYILNIPHAKAEDSGMYKCSAENFAGSDERSIRLQVKFKPSLRPASARVGQAVGYPKSLMCYVEGYPQPNEDQVTWSHSNNKIYNVGRYEITNIKGAYNRITSILTIKTVYPSDYGIYRCAATNEQGDGQTSIELYASDDPTADRSGVVSRSSMLKISLTTIIMLLTTCLLHGLKW